MTTSETTATTVANGGGVGRDAWRQVDEGWGRRAVDFATLSEPANSREYVRVHQQLGVGQATRLLDIACGSGLAIELARARGATCAGIDASPRLIAVAQDRNPESDIRVGDMHDLPWSDESFDVVTSFRGIWGTTPDALREVWRVLRPGGRVGLTVWGHIKASPGAWALAPFRLASQPKVANQAAMVRLGRPGAGEQLLEEIGFADVERITIPMVWEFPDPATYARTLASTGPAYEAIQTVGEEAFLAHAEQLATERMRNGLPLRAQVDVVGYVAVKPLAAEGSATGFIAPGTPSDATDEMFERDRQNVGFLMNVTRVWALAPERHTALFDLLDQAAHAASLTFRERGILVTACASVRGDSYCALAWGVKLGGKSGYDVVESVLRGDDDLLSERERAMATWARRVAADPNATRESDLDELRAVGFDDAAILGLTTFVGLRIAFSTVNDALGIRPDHQLGEAAPVGVRQLVTYGRPIAAVCV